MNKIFDKLIKSKIEQFVVEYKNLSRQIFVNEDGVLIHPGEFGIYREKIIKKLIEPFLPSRLAIGSGFIITHNDNISTQCDIIIYDKENTPIIETDEQRFFPIECVAGVIEVKSKLTKAQMKEALIKLTNIKNLRNDINTNIYTYKDGNNYIPFNTKINVRDQIATFLVCEKVDMDYEKDINTFFKETYSGVDKSLYHNMILSLDDGCFMYFDGKVSIYHSYFNYEKDNFINELLIPHSLGYDYEHILIFVNYFFMLISSISILYLEMTEYLGKTRPKFIYYEQISKNSDNK